MVCAMAAGEPARIRRRTLFGVLLLIDGMFVVLHLLTRVISIDGEPVVRRHEFLNLDAEISFSTWWACTQLVGAAALCLLLAHLAPDRESNDGRYWRALGFTFLLLSIDEGVQFHEGLTGPTRRALDIGDGVLGFAWVIPVSAALLVFGLAFIRFWARLQRWPRLLMALSGVLFVGGALGFELISGAYTSENDHDTGYALLVVGEEGLELVGVSVFVLSLLTVLRASQPRDGVTLRVED